MGLYITGTDDARKNHFADLTAAFQEESGQQVEPEYVSIEQSQQELTTRVGGGDPPAISYYPGRWLADFADLGALEPVERAAVEGFAESAVEGGEVNGELYGMPWGFSTRALFSELVYLQPGEAGRGRGSLRLRQLGGGRVEPTHGLSGGRRDPGSHPLHPRPTLPHRRSPQRGHKGLAPVLPSLPWKME